MVNKEDLTPAPPLFFVKNVDATPQSYSSCYLLINVFIKFDTNPFIAAT